MAVGGNARYPSLQTITQLFRSSINDDGAGATGTVGEGLVATNAAPFMLPFLNSAIRETFSDLRSVGDPALILDNYILTGIPALAAPNPAVQVSLSYAGFFDGTQWHAQWTLPLTCERVEAIWERANGSGAGFFPLTPAPFGLPGMAQGSAMSQWEMRQNAVWMPGALMSVDLRIRCRITLPDFVGSSINFATAYIPILDCENVIVAKMLILYARRFAPEQYQLAVAEEQRYMSKLRLEVVRQQQTIQNERAAFGEEATAGNFCQL